MKQSIINSLLPLLIIAAFPLFTTATSTILPELDLPAPTGKYKVGTTHLYFVDKSRNERFSGGKTDFRELALQAWYPANPGTQNKMAPYLRKPEVTGPAFSKLYLQSLPKKLGTFSQASMDKIVSGKTHSFLEAPLAGGEERYPVVIFSHGFAGSSAQNTAQMEDLASHGYVVFSISHTHEAVVTLFPDGRTVLYSKEEAMKLTDKEQDAKVDVLMRKLEAAKSPEDKLPIYKQVCEASAHIQISSDVWAGDIKFIAEKLKTLDSGKVPPENLPDGDRFKGRLDLEKIGAMGHSLGGTASVQALAEDGRIKAAVNMDGLSYGTWQFKSPVTRPYMKMQSQSSESFMYSTIYKMATGPAYEITVKGAEHYNFTDMAFFPAFMKKLGIIGPIDGKRGVKIMNVYSLAFFDKHLNSIKTSLLNGPSKEYPEVAFESRNLQK